MRDDDGEPATRVLVMGCGGIGGIVAGHLSELGVEVHAVSRNPAVVDAVTRQGFRIVGEGGYRQIPGNVHLTVPDLRFDYALLATQPTDVEDAARQALPALGDDGHLVCFQNGLCEDRVAAVVGDPARVIGAVVAWGGSMVEPGLFDRTSVGGFVLGGALPGHAQSPAIQRLAALLECIGPVETTDDLAGARWSKLAINCAISALGTLAGTSLGKAMRSRTVRRLALEIMSEVVAVARAAGVKLQKVSGTVDLEWCALTESERQQEIGSIALAAKHTLLLAVGMRFRRMRSSMLRAIEAGRPPAVDYLNGEIVERGRRYEVPVPVNAAMVDRIWAISRGEVKPGMRAVYRFFADTRTPVA